MATKPFRERNLNILLPSIVEHTKSNKDIVLHIIPLRVVKIIKNKKSEEKKDAKTQLSSNRAMRNHNKKRESTHAVTEIPLRVAKSSFHVSFN